MQGKALLALAAVAGTTTAATFGVLCAPKASAKRGEILTSAQAEASASGRTVPAVARAFRGPDLSNRAAYIPAQCYAKTRDADGKTHNGCFVCHQDSRVPNYVNDGDVQTQLSLPSYAAHNRWQNALEPVAASTLGDDELLIWVRTSNYLDADGGLKLARALAQPPAAWDANHDGAWSGFMPDAWFHFDAEGFDRDPNGRSSGWRAYTSLPTPGLFMPTNGSVGDTLIRLPPEYRQDESGAENLAIYRHQSGHRGGVHSSRRSADCKHRRARARLGSRRRWRARQGHAGGVHLAAQAGTTVSLRRQGRDSRRAEGRLARGGAVSARHRVSAQRALPGRAKRQGHDGRTHERATLHAQAALPQLWAARPSRPSRGARKAQEPRQAKAGVRQCRARRDDRRWLAHARLHRRRARGAAAPKHRRDDGLHRLPRRRRRNDRRDLHVRAQAAAGRLSRRLVSLEPNTASKACPSRNAPMDAANTPTT